MNKILKIVTSGTMMAMFQIPMMLPSNYALAPKAEIISSSAPVQSNVIDEFFGDASQSIQDGILAKQIAFVSSRDAYSASLGVVEKHQAAIKSSALAKNVPQDVAIGVALLENGGSETAKSPAGALGIYQLMPSTAKSLGMTVNKQVDDRRDPLKSIEAGLTYLKSNFERFGDWGLATWAYHAGEGNVAKAVKIYARVNDGIKLAGVSDAASMRNYVITHDINIHKLLSDPSVKRFTDNLNDDSGNYAYKVLATATLFRQAQ